MTESNQVRAAGYDFVPAKSIDLAHLNAFSATVWPECPADHLVSRWWRRAEPSCAIAAVHEATGAMAGFCSARPSDWVVNRQTVSTVAICDWYVDPAHAGKGLGKCLLRRLETGDKFVFAFSLSDAAVANFKKLGWAGPHRACLMLLPLPTIAKFRAAIFASRTAVELEDWVIESAELSAIPVKRALVQYQDRVSLDDSAQ